MASGNRIADPVLSVNSKQLVTAALAGEPIHRVPVGPLAVHFCAGIAGCTLEEYSTDPGVLAEAVIRYHERFRPDAVWLSADTWVSAEAMGARVGSTDPHQPLGGLGKPLVTAVSDLERIPAPDVTSQARYPLMLEACARIVDALGKDVFVVACFDQFPFSLAAALMGMNEIMVKVMEDPPFVTALMERCEEYAIAYATALARTGVDMLSGGDSPAGLVSPRLYAELIQPVERRVVSRLKEVTRQPVSLHVCGQATPLLKGMADTGADVLEIDHAVDLAEACEIVGPGVALWGNLDPVAVLAHGTPAAVQSAARAALEATAKTGHSRFVLSSGCTLAVETPAANLDALGRAAREREDDTDGTAREDEHAIAHRVRRVEDRGAY